MTKENEGGAGGVEEKQLPAVERAKGPLARAIGLAPEGGAVDGLGSPRGDAAQEEKTTEEVIRESKLSPSLRDLLDSRSGDAPPGGDRKQEEAPSGGDHKPEDQTPGGEVGGSGEPDDFDILGEGAGEGTDDYELPDPAARRARPPVDDGASGRRREEDPAAREDNTRQPEPIDMPEGLAPEHEERFELAQFAAGFDPKKYGDLPKKYADFFKAHRKFIDDRTIEDADYNPEEDLEYDKFIRRNQPQLSPKEIRVLNRELIKAEVRKDVESQYKGDIENLQNRLKKFEKSSEQNEKLQAFSEAAQSALPGEVTDLIEKEGEDAAREKFPHLMDMYDETLAHNQTLATAYYELINGIADLDFEGRPEHGELADYIDKVGYDFYETGGKRRVRGGRKFVPRSKFVELQKAGESDGYWTFSHDDIFKLLGRKTAKDFDARKKTEADRLRKWGYEVPWDSGNQEEPGGKAPKVSSPRMPGQGAGDDHKGESSINPAVARMLGGGPRR